jgi:hypothetical protein
MPAWFCLFLQLSNPAANSGSAAHLVTIRLLTSAAQEQFSSAPKSGPILGAARVLAPT